MILKRIMLFVLTLAVFLYISVVAFDNNNSNKIIFKDPVLILEAVAGDGQGQFGFQASGGELWPHDFVVDPIGNIWIADYMNKRVQKFDSDGNYVMEFPGKSNISSVELECDYIVCDLRGNIVVGVARDGSMVVLDNNGKFLRSFKLPGVMGASIDFALNSSGEILYRKGVDKIAVDLEGNVLYASKDVPWVAGSEVSPYSEYIVEINDKLRQVNVYCGETFKNVKKERSINFDGDFKSQGPFGVYKRALLADKEGNLYVGTIIARDKWNKVRYSFHAPDGKHLQTLEDSKGFNENKIWWDYYTIDKDGSFYIMKIQRPEGTEIIPNKLIKGGTPCLRIWKWERIKE